ncbi:hypothetical protein SAMN05661093_08997 [Kibdelosporangium aridum]|uniref:Arsenate reductase n=2 Tax=Kibdelosporangium aridum TaxID=2030 RepID=A0A1W2FTG7_KIBAR|nr:hypothetical protein SAMN05661093_08997 [Kibdelosporangium aridum]
MTCGCGCTTEGGLGGSAAMTGWVLTEACTLPTAGQAVRIAEFDGLFTTSLLDMSREESGWLRLRLGGGADVESRARDLTAREAECCAFFDFAVGRDGGQVIVDVRVPADKELVLDGLAAQAEAVLTARGGR